jgi:hypothetical protein
MENYFPIGLLVFLISGLIVVKVGLEKRPTYKEADERYQNAKLCEEIQKKKEERHKVMEEKLQCIPEIKEKVTRIDERLKMLLHKNGIPVTDE